MLGWLENHPNIYYRTCFSSKRQSKTIRHENNMYPEIRLFLNNENSASFMQRRTVTLRLSSSCPGVSC